MKPSFLFAAAVLAGASATAPLFENIAPRAGIGWIHFNGQSDDRFLVESTTGGIAFLDYDGDGWQDLLLINGGETPRGKSARPVRNALYRNTGNGRWTEAAAKAGIDRIPFYGMGAAVSDFDNDGHSDVYISGYPSGALFHNNGDGTFTDVTERAGVANAGEWGAGAAWFDYDRDGMLDLFIANYAEFSFAGNRRCDFLGYPAYCAQTDYSGRPPRLYRNKGQGRFEDVTAAAGLKNLAGRALGVVAIDVNRDGWTDLFVARDASPNLLLLNNGKGAFRDAGLEAEVAFNADGVARAGMGVDAGDVNGDGYPDFVVTNFDSEYHALYLGGPKLPLREATVSSHLAALTRNYVGWGVRFLDYDNDGHQDLLLVNGHLHEMIAKANQSVSWREPPLLLRNDGSGVFQKVSAGPAFDRGYLSRGLATADFDNDGAVDAAFVNLNEPPVLLHNIAARKNHWIGVQLRGNVSNRDGIGARVTYQREGGALTRWAAGGGSFLAGHDHRLVFGLAQDDGPGTVVIEWPSGQVQKIPGLAIDRYHTITEPETR